MKSTFLEPPIPPRAGQGRHGKDNLLIFNMSEPRKVRYAKKLAMSVGPYLIANSGSYPKSVWCNFKCEYKGLRRISHRTTGMAGSPRALLGGAIGGPPPALRQCEV